MSGDQPGRGHISNTSTDLKSKMVRSHPKHQKIQKCSHAAAGPSAAIIGPSAPVEPERTVQGRRADDIILPRRSTFAIYAYIGVVLGVNVGKYGIHGVSGQYRALFRWRRIRLRGDAWVFGFRSCHCQAKCWICSLWRKDESHAGLGPRTP